MFDFIRKLQRLSDRKRRGIALSFAGGVTAVIFTVWMVTVINTGATTDAVAESETRAAASPITSVKESFVRIFGEADQEPQTESASTTFRTEPQ